MSKPKYLVVDPAKSLDLKLSPSSAVSFTLRITNSSSSTRCAFKVKTTSRERYLVRPNQGVIDCNTTAEVEIRMLKSVCQELLTYGWDMDDTGSADKFLVQSVIVPKPYYDSVINLPSKQQTGVLSKLWSNAAKSTITNKKLRVFFVTPEEGEDGSVASEHGTIAEESSADLDGSGVVDMALKEAPAEADLLPHADSTAAAADGGSATAAAVADGSSAGDDEDAAAAAGEGTDGAASGAAIVAASVGGSSSSSGGAVAGGAASPIAKSSTAKSTSSAAAAKAAAVTAKAATAGGDSGAASSGSGGGSAGGEGTVDVARMLELRRKYDELVKYTVDLKAKCESAESAADKLQHELAQYRAQSAARQAAVEATPSSGSSGDGKSSSSSSSSSTKLPPAAVVPPPAAGVSYVQVIIVAIVAMLIGRFM